MLIVTASQVIPRLSWNPKVHYSVHKIPQSDPILSQFHLVHMIKNYFFKIYVIIILPWQDSVLQYL